MEKGEQETEGAHGGGIWHLSGSRVGGGFSAPPPPAEGHPSHRSRWSCHDTVTLPWQWWPRAGQPRTFKTHTYFWVNLSEGERRGGRFVCAVCSFPVQKCQRPSLCCFFLPSFPSLQGPGWRKVSWHGKVDKQTNKQTEGIKIEEKQQMKRGSVFLSPWGWLHVAAITLRCVLCPPLAATTTAWQGCQCHVISRFCSTTRTSKVAVFSQGGKGRLHLIW